MKNAIWALALLAPLTALGAETHSATLEVSVAENGRATDVKVIESTVSKDALAAIIQDAVERGYAPEFRDGRAVAGTVIYSVEVSLERKADRRAVAMKVPARICPYCTDEYSGQSVGF